MKVYKFGGASLKNATCVKNIATVLRKIGYQDTVMVVSAMGKTTNDLEEVVKMYFSRKDIYSMISKITQDHFQITTDLFPMHHAIFSEIEIFFSEMKDFIQKNSSTNYDFVYDQIVSFGELISTKIISQYLALIKIQNVWLDVRNYIKTDINYREAHVDWQQTAKKIKTLNSNVFYITQGFIGSDFHGSTTTLGREGSDYTAAIFSWSLNAESQTIWKDVPGVLNADPRYFSESTLLEQISYEEAIELSYYGASIIHPKTLKPLQDKSIPLYVRSFLHIDQPGTVVKNGLMIFPVLPCYILKKDQVLLSFSSKNFSFIVEHNLSEIFQSLSDFSIKVHFMKRSAMIFSVCMEDAFHHLDQLLDKFKFEYNIRIIKNVSLYTLRHYDEKSVQKISSKKKILLHQFTKETAQWIVEE